METKLINNVGFLKSVISSMIEKIYQMDIIDNNMEEEMIGPGLAYENQQEWFNGCLEEHMDNAALNTVPFPKQQDNVTVSEDTIRNAIQYYKLPLGESFITDDGTEVRRVPGGWVFFTFRSGSASSILVPFNKEFEHFSEDTYE